MILCPADCGPVQASWTTIGDSRRLEGLYMVLHRLLMMAPRGEATVTGVDSSFCRRRLYSDWRYRRRRPVMGPMTNSGI